MRTIKLLLFCILASTLLVGCATYNAPHSNRYYWKREPPTTTAHASAEDNTIRVQIESEGDMEVAAAIITNISDGAVTILWDKSSYSYADGNSSRIVTGETRRIDVTRSQPPLTIGKGNSTREAIVPVKAVESDSIEPWIEKGGEFLIAYEQEAKPRFLTVPFESVDRTSGSEILVNRIEQKRITKILGNVSVSQLRWHPLFIGFPGLIRSSLRGEANVEARAQYGENIELVNEQFESEWHPLSLLIGLSMYGWVEKASLSATVIPDRSAN